jgi:hypothetical protein
VKKPDAQTVHDVAPPIENRPATQSEQVASAIVVPLAEMKVPAAQYVWVVHAEAATPEYFPLAQSVQALAPPAENFPAAHSTQEVAATE